MPVKDAAMAHQVSLTDDEYKLVLSRLGDRLRIAGTAELNGCDRDLNRVRCEAIVLRVERLFPGAGDTSQKQFRTGLWQATIADLPCRMGRSGTLGHCGVHPGRSGDEHRAAGKAGFRHRGSDRLRFVRGGGVAVGRAGGVPIRGWVRSDRSASRTAVQDW